MGKNGPNSSLQEKIEGVMQQWEALENGLVVGFPMQWVQAWVMASVNQSLGEIDQDGLTETTAFKLRSQIMLPAPMEMAELKASADNARLGCSSAVMNIYPFINCASSLYTPIIYVCIRFCGLR